MEVNSKMLRTCKFMHCVIVKTFFGKLELSLFKINHPDGRPSMKIRIKMS